LREKHVFPYGSIPVELQRSIGLKLRIVTRLDIPELPPKLKERKQPLMPGLVKVLGLIVSEH
jgi:hypothetical protein